MHMPTFMIHTIKQVWLLVQQGGDAFSFDVIICIFQLLSIIFIILMIYLSTKAISMESFAFWAGYSP